MKKLKFNISKYKKPKSKHKTQWQELGEELTNYFGVNCYWVLWKYDTGRVRTEFGVCKQEGIFQLKALLYKLNNNHMNEKKIVERILEAYNKGDIRSALNQLKMSKSILKKVTWDYLYNRMEPDVLKKAQNVFGGEIVDIADEDRKQTTMRLKFKLQH